MHWTLWALAVAAVLVLLAWGFNRPNEAVEVPLSDAQAQGQIETLQARLSAAIDNDRSVEPVLQEARVLAEARPGMVAVHRLMGQAHAHAGRIAAAYAAFERALRLDPQDAQLQSLAGTAASQLGRADAAEGHHQLAVAMAPGEARLLLPLANLYLQSGRYDAARGAFIRALELDMTLHQANAGLSDVYRNRGEPGDQRLAIDQMEKAIAKLRRTRTETAQRDIYARKLAGVYAAMDQPMEAIRVLGSLPDRSLYSPGVSRDLAGYFEANGQAALAGLHYEMVLRQRPADGDAAAASASWYLKAGDSSAAHSMIEHLERIRPHHERLPELRAALRQAHE